MIACFCDKNGTSHIGTDYYLRVDGRLTRNNQIDAAREYREQFKKHFRCDYDDMTHVMFVRRIRDLPDAYNGRHMPVRYPIVSPQITKGK